MNEKQVKIRGLRQVPGTIQHVISTTILSLIILIDKYYTSRREKKAIEYWGKCKYIPMKPMPSHRTMPAYKKKIIRSPISFYLASRLVVEWGDLHKLLMQAKLRTVSLSHQQMDWVEEAPKSSKKPEKILRIHFVLKNGRFTCFLIWIFVTECLL